MEFANSVVTLIGNIFSCGLILAFLIGIIYGIGKKDVAKLIDDTDGQVEEALDSACSLQNPP